MARKSFKDNPALRFISPPAPDEEDMPAAALPEPAAAPYPVKLNPLYMETKSRRLNLLVRPSLHERIKKLAKSRKSSVNELIHQVLAEYADREDA